MDTCQALTHANSHRAYLRRAERGDIAIVSWLSTYRATSLPRLVEVDDLRHIDLRFRLVVLWRAFPV
jgi:hypothetical protein